MSFFDEMFNEVEAKLKALAPEGMGVDQQTQQEPVLPAQEQSFGDYRQSETQQAPELPVDMQLPSTEYIPQQSPDYVAPQPAPQPEPANTGLGADQVLYQNTVLPNQPKPTLKEFVTQLRQQRQNPSFMHDLGQTISDNINGGVAGYKELQKQNTNLADMYVHNEDGSFATDENGNAILKPEYTQNDADFQTGMRQKALETWNNETVKPTAMMLPMVPGLGAAGTIAAAPFIGEYLGKQAAEGYEKNGVSGALWNTTFEPAYDFANDPDLSKKWQQHPFQTMAEGGMAAAQALAPIVGARYGYKGIKKGADKLKEVQDEFNRVLDENPYEGMANTGLDALDQYDSPTRGFRPATQDELQQTLLDQLKGIQQQKWDDASSQSYMNFLKNDAAEQNALQVRKNEIAGSVLMNPVDRMDVGADLPNKTRLGGEGVVLGEQKDPAQLILPDNKPTPAAVEKPFSVPSAEDLIDEVHTKFLNKQLTDAVNSKDYATVNDVLGKMKDEGIETPLSKAVDQGNVKFSNKGNEIPDEWQGLYDKVLEDKLGIKMSDQLTPEQASLSKMGDAMGVPVRFFDGEKNLRGFHDHASGTSYLNVNGERGADWAFWHENLHWLRENDPELYKGVFDTIKDKVTPEQVDAYRRTIAQSDLPHEQILEEMIADQMGDAATRGKWLEQLQNTNPSLYQRFMQWVQNLINRFKGREQGESLFTPEQAKAVEGSFNDVLSSLKDRVGTEERGTSMPIGDAVPQFSKINMSDSDKIRKFFHGSYEDDLTHIKENEGSFDGMFFSPSPSSALSHGKSLYHTELKQSEIMKGTDFFGEEKTINKVIREQTKIPKQFYPQLRDLITEDEFLFDMSENEQQKWLNRLGKYDVGEADWEIQRLRGKVASKLGYKAVEMQDEHGTSYLVFHNAKLTKSVEDIDYSHKKSDKDLRQSIEQLYPKETISRAAINASKNRFEAISGGLKEAGAAVRNLFSPASADEYSQRASHALRSASGDMYDKRLQDEKSLTQARDFFDTLPKADQVEVSCHMQDPEYKFSGPAKEFVDAVRGAYEPVGKELVERGYLDSSNEYYHAQLWENTPANKAKIEAWRGDTRRLNKGFLQEKEIPSYEVGIRLGLKPKYTNPVDVAFQRLGEERKFLAMQNFLEEISADGMVSDTQHPGWVKVDSSLTSHWGGSWYVPESVGRIIRNTMSVGIRDMKGAGPVFRAYMAVGNLMNQFQLMGGFHAGFTSAETMQTRAALALKYGELATKSMIRGDAKNAGKMVLNAATNTGNILTAPITSYKAGSKLLSMLGDESHANNPIVQLYKMGGGRVKLDTLLLTDFRRAFRIAVKQGDYAKAIGEAPLAGVEKMMSYIIENLVPRQKLGAFTKMAEYELKRDPNLMQNRAKAQEVASRLIDSVDNRLGQMNYDNLHWNNKVKDGMMGTFRAPGWMIGTIRELLGGVIDTAGVVGRYKKGDDLITHRMSYALALPITTAMLNTIGQVLSTGTMPEGYKDNLLGFKNGLYDIHGVAQRSTFPTYMKDVYHWLSSPTHTAVNKVHPLISALANLANNKDYYGVQIRDKDDPYTKQAADVATYAAKQFLPFSITGGIKTREDGGDWVKTLLPQIGVTPAPAAINKTDAEKVIAEIYEGRRKTGAMTQEEFDKIQLKRTLARGVADNGGATKELRDAVVARQISPQEARNIIASPKQSSIQHGINHLGLDDAMKVWEAADNGEKEQIRPIIYKKIANSKTLTPQQKKDMASRIK